MVKSEASIRLVLERLWDKLDNPVNEYDFRLRSEILAQIEALHWVLGYGTTKDSHLNP